jgi:glycosyltransferase involved in cell wall biosynthesis
LKTKKILYITYDGLTGALGQSQILPYVIQLTKEGYQYTILSFEKKDELQKNKDNISRLLQEHGIGWEPLTFTTRPPILAKLYDLLRMKATVKKLYRQHRFHLVHCRSYIAGQMGLLLKQKFGCRFLFDMRGFWVDERVDGGLWNLSKPFYRHLYKRYKGIEKALLAGADHVIALTENGKAELSANYGVAAQKITVIPCCVDTDFFDPTTISAEAVAALKKDLQIGEEDYILTYIGKLGTWYMLDEMLQFYRTLRHKQPKARFLLLVDHNQRQVEQLVIEKGFQLRDFIIKKATRAEVPLYLFLSDSSVFFIKPAYSKKGSSPIKFGELLSMGIPVICNGRVGDMDWIMKDQNLGALVHEFTDAAYAEAAETVMRQTFDPAYIRSKALQEFSVTNGSLHYQNVYALLLDEPAPTLVLS